MSSPAPQLRSGLKPALGYAAYLGTSWTWVIGMLFPALILRDYGLWGFVAFAIPNVVGAAAMGFVLTPERARGILERHRTACAWFSVVTMAFHLSVMVWLLPALLGPWSVGIVVLTVAACLAAKKIAGVKGIWAASALVWLLSMAMFWKGAHTNEAWNTTTAVINGHGSVFLPPQHWSWKIGWLGIDGLMAFIPASILGFALCPYLDLTFLKARAETSRRTGQAAFAIGFGIVFFAMILFTVMYSGLIQTYFYTSRFPGGPGFSWGTTGYDSNLELPAIWKTILMAHLPVQIGLTLAWHGLELFPPQNRTSVRKVAIWGCLLGILGVYIGILLFGRSTETLYRSFLLLYGTLLPAYVLLKMIPTRAPVHERFRTLIFICASILSYPLAWGAFVLHHHWLIIPCAGVLTIAFLAVQFGPKAQTQETAA